MRSATAIQSTGPTEAPALCPAPVLRTRVMRQPQVPLGRAVAMNPGEVEHGE